METTPENATKEEGLRLIKAGQIADAIAVLKKVAAANPDDPQVHSYLGVAYNQNHDKLHAIAEFEEALRLEESAKAYYNLGQMYESVHRTDEAIRQYRMAIDLEPDYAQAQQALEKLHARFAAEHPELVPQAQEPSAADTQQTQVMGGPAPDVPQATQAFAAQAPQAGSVGMPGHNPDGTPVRYGGPPPMADRRLQKELEIAEHARAMMKSGLIYGMVCGAFLMPLVYFGASRFVISTLPEFVTRGAGMIYFIMILAMGGAIYGGLIGLWVGKTCGGKGAGMQAGAALGAFAGLLLGLLGGGSVYEIFMMMIMYAVVSGGLGLLIGRLVDSSIGWD